MEPINIEPMNKDNLALTETLINDCKNKMKTFKNGRAKSILKMAYRRLNRAWKNNALSYGDYSRWHNEGSNLLLLAEKFETGEYE